HLGLCCAASPGDLTGVAHLTAGLSVEGCSIENQLDGLARVGLRSFHATRADDCLQRAFTVVSLALVSEKLGLAYLLGEALVYVLDRSFALADEPRLLALLLHACLVSRLVDVEAALAGDYLGQVPGEAMRIVQEKHHLSGENLVAGVLQLLDFFVDEPKPSIERLAKGFLLVAGNFENEAAVLLQLRVRVAHDLDHPIDRLPEKRLTEPQLCSMPDGAPDNSPQHVPATLVRGLNAVGNQECRCPRMVRDDAHRCAVVFRAAVGLAGELLDLLQNGLEQVRVVVGAFSLDNGSQTFQARAGIDRGFRQ